MPEQTMIERVARQLRERGKTNGSKVFGADVDYAQLVTLYGPTVTAPAATVPQSASAPRRSAWKASPTSRMSRPATLSARTSPCGCPCVASPGSTNGFSKKLENHVHALAFYFAFYNFCRMHKTLRVSPAMAAGITDRLWSLEDVLARIDAMAPTPAKHGPYRKRGTEAVD